MTTTASLIKWSFSSLKLFETCPKKYFEIRLVKNFADVPGKEALYGTALHTAAEEYVRDGKELPKGFKFIQTKLDMLTKIEGEKLTEFGMALDAQLTPCDFDSEDYFCRGIADLIVLDRPNKRAFIVDYKSGKSAKYADTDQLALMAFMLFRYFPEIEVVKAGLLFVVANTFIKVQYTREDMAQLPARFQESLARLTNAMRYGVFNEKPNGLCRNYCVVTSCVHNGRR
jgi:hypothetical protein